MPKTAKTKRPVMRKTRTKRSKTNTLRQFENEIAVKFLEILVMVKLYHWKTHSYATHKSTDSLHDKLHDHTDKFIEILLGKTGIRIDLTKRKTMELIDLDSQDKLKAKVEQFKSYLVNLTNNPAIKSMSNTDLLNVRDEILGDMNQFLYLLSFK